MIGRSVLPHILMAWTPFLYGSVFFGMMLEGELFLFAGTFLAHQGALDMTWVLFLAASGLLIGDFGWYFAGKYLMRRVKWLNRMAHKYIGVFDKHFTDRPLTTILISKLAYGIHRVILLRAGQKMPFRTYARCIIIADVLWFTAVVLLAVVFSATVGPVLRHWLRYIEILILLVVLGFIFFERIVEFISEKFLD